MPCAPMSCASSVSYTHLGDRVPSALLMAMMLAAALLAGTLWGVIPAIFKAQWNTNETLFTLMMNYIATQLVAFCIVFWENPSGSNSVGIINQQTRAGWLGELFGLTYGWNLVIVVAVTAFVYFYLRDSKQGYEIAYVCLLYTSRSAPAGSFTDRIDRRFRSARLQRPLAGGHERHDADQPAVHRGAAGRLRWLSLIHI